MAMNMISCASKPHVLMMPYPLQGHITPLMQLSKLLAARGFAVTFVTSESNVKKMLKAKQKLKASELGKLGIKLVGIADGLLEMQEPGSRLQEVDNFFASLLIMRDSFDELVGRMVQEEGLTITCIISDSFLVWTQDVANKWRIPRASFWPNSLATFSCTMSVPNIMAACPTLDPFKAQVYESGGSSQSPKLLNCIPGISEIEACKLPFHIITGERHEEHYRDNVQSLIGRVNEPRCMIINSFPDLEREIHMHIEELLPSNKPMFMVGPLSPLGFMGGLDDENAEGTGTTLEDEDEECMEWLDKQSSRSVLYIALGSLVVPQESDIQEILLGLEASQQPFLWVLPSSTCEPSIDTKKLQGLFVRWAPQLRVLSHEAVGGFLTHCGWNSTLESMSMGVPVICWPKFLDQLTNCWFLVEKLKVGVRLELDESQRVRRASVEKAIRTLMQEEEGILIRARASQFQCEMRSSLTTSLPARLDSLVTTIISFHANCPLPERRV